MSDDGERFSGWAILELMGHRRLAGWVQEVELAGAGMLRLDVPASVQPVERGELTLEDTAVTQFYPPSALYCLTPVTEMAARRVAASSRPSPVKPFELLPAGESVRAGGRRVEPPASCERCDHDETRHSGEPPFGCLEEECPCSGFVEEIPF